MTAYERAKLWNQNPKMAVWCGRRDKAELDHRIAAAAAKLHGWTDAQREAAEKAAATIGHMDTDGKLWPAMLAAAAAAK